MATLRDTFSDIADAIRDKGITGTMTPLEMPTKIGQIQTGGTSEPMYGLDLSAYGLTPYNQYKFNGPAQRQKRYRLVLSGVTKLIDTWALAGLAGCHHTLAVGPLPAYARYLPAISACEFPDLTSTTNTGPFESMFCGNGAVISADFSNLVNASGTGTFVGAFKACSSLVDVKFNDGLSVNPYSTFDTCFESCTNLSTVPNIPGPTLTGFAYNTFNSTFSGCTKLTDKEGIGRLISSWSRVAQEKTFYYMCNNCKGLTGHLDLTVLSCSTITSDMSQPYYQAFGSCTGLTSLTLQIPESKIAYMFKSCTNLSEVEITQMSSLANTCSNAFSGCKLNKLTLRDVVTMASPSYTFASSVPTGVTDRELYLPSMETITGTASGSSSNWFYWATFGQFTKFYFPNVTNITNKNIFGSASYAGMVKEIHFAASNQSAIEALTGYATKFGATNAIIYFDL